MLTHRYQFGIHIIQATNLGYQLVLNSITHKLVMNIDTTSSYKMIKLGYSFIKVNWQTNLLCFQNFIFSTIRVTSRYIVN